VVVNLYPFEQTIARPNVTESEAIEQIDIGGPAMLRAAAKNFANLTVLCNPGNYNDYLQELRQNGGEAPLNFRKVCAQKAFGHTAAYDRAIATYLSDDSLQATSPGQA
jgi:phosphoribosylaminoimidazolecarboxamide formyltransferase/IMP cyclohydrolase